VVLQGASPWGTPTQHAPASGRVHRGPEHIARATGSMIYYRMMVLIRPAMHVKLAASKETCHGVASKAATTTAKPNTTKMSNERPPKRFHDFAKTCKQTYERVLSKIEKLERHAAEFGGTTAARAAKNALLVCLAEPAREKPYQVRCVITLASRETCLQLCYQGSLSYMEDLFGTPCNHFPRSCLASTRLLRHDRRRIEWPEAAANVSSAFINLTKKGWEGFMIMAYPGCREPDVRIIMGTGPAALPAVQVEGGLYRRVMDDLPRVLELQDAALSCGASLQRSTDGRRTVAAGSTDVFAAALVSSLRLLADPRRSRLCGLV
jgi:hypothetical protein